MIHQSPGSGASARLVPIRRRNSLGALFVYRESPGPSYRSDQIQPPLQHRGSFYELGSKSHSMELTLRRPQSCLSAAITKRRRRFRSGRETAFDPRLATAENLRTPGREFNMVDKLKN